MGSNTEFLKMCETLNSALDAADRLKLNVHTISDSDIECCNLQMYLLGNKNIHVGDCFQYLGHLFYIKDNYTILEVCTPQELLEHSVPQRAVDYYNNYSNLIYSAELTSIIADTKQIQYQLWFGTNGVVLYTDGTGGSVTRTYDEYLADTLQYSRSQVTDELDRINQDIEEMYAIICSDAPTKRSIKTYISELWTIIKDSMRSVFEWIAQFIP